MPGGRSDSPTAAGHGPALPDETFELR